MATVAFLSPSAMAPLLPCARRRRSRRGQGMSTARWMRRGGTEEWRSKGRAGQGGQRLACARALTSRARGDDEANRDGGKAPTRSRRGQGGRRRTAPAKARCTWSGSCSTWPRGDHVVPAALGSGADGVGSARVQSGTKVWLVRWCARRAAWPSPCTDMVAARQGCATWCVHG